MQFILEQLLLKPRAEFRDYWFDFGKEFLVSENLQRKVTAADPLLTENNTCVMV